MGNFGMGATRPEAEMLMGSAGNGSMGRGATALGVTGLEVTGLGVTARGATAIGAAGKAGLSAMANVVRTRRPVFGSTRTTVFVLVPDFAVGRTRSPAQQVRVKQRAMDRRVKVLLINGLYQDGMMRR